MPETSPLPAFPSIWGDAQAVPPEGMERNFSVRGFADALTVLFDALKCDLDGPDAPLSRSVSVTVRAAVQIGDEEPFLGFLQHLRGVTHLTPGGRVSIAVAAGGRVDVLEFRNDGDPAQSEREDRIPGLRSDPFFRSVFTLAERPPKAENPAGFFAIPSLEVTLLLHAHRRTADDVASVTIDSLDVAVVRGRGPAKTTSS